MSNALGEHRIVVLLLSPSFVVVTRLRAAIGSECEVLCATSLAHARRHFTTRRIAAALLETEDTAGAQTAPLVQEMRSLYAALPVVAIVRRSAGFTAATMALVEAQPTAVVLAEELDVLSLLRSLVPRFRASELVADVWPSLEPDLPSALQPLVRLALARSASPLTVHAAALALGLHRKTLWSHCRRHGVGSVQALVMWCRLIAVAHALRTRSHSVDAIANEMEFASPTALRNAIRRYLGITATALRTTGGEEIACDAFRTWLADARARHGVTTSDAA